MRFHELAAREQRLFESEFLSPVLANRSIKIRLDGVIVSLSISPRDFQGWAICKPTSYKAAVVSCPATLKQRNDYLNLFPALRFVLCYERHGTWFGIPYNDQRFHVVGCVPIHLTENAQQFNTVVARYDGNIFWYDTNDMHVPLNVADDLRLQMNQRIDPSKIKCRNLLPIYSRAYSIAFTNTAESESSKIKKAVEFMGARYKGHIDRGDVYTIEYSVDGHHHKSTVRKSDLRVESAGICLSGGDRQFDMTSLVGVIREGYNKNRIVRTDRL